MVVFLKCFVSHRLLGIEGCQGFHNEVTTNRRQEMTKIFFFLLNNVHSGVEVFWCFGVF